MPQLLVALALLSGCAPTYSALARKCPTTTQLAGDFTVTAVSFAMSALRYNREQYAQSAGYAAFGLALAVADNITEVRACRAR